jgi:hypothetical protein
MQVARLTFAAQRRSDRPFRISPLTIYEANFREKLTKNCQKSSGPNSDRPENQHQPCLSDTEDVGDRGWDDAESFPSVVRHG